MQAVVRRALLIAGVIAFGSCMAARQTPKPISDPRDGALKLERWTRAADSSAATMQSVSPRCLRDVGCPFKPVAIARCPAPIRTLTVAEALRRPASTEKIFVRGRLHADSVVTLLACSERTCCNTSGGELALSEDVDAMLHGEALRFSSSTRPRAFACAGDDSAECCGFEPGEVIALGEVREGTMSEPLLCKP